MVIEEVPVQTRLAELASQYIVAGNRSVEQIFVAADAIVAANDELSKKLLPEFYRQIGIKENGSTDKKWQKIGAMKTRFLPFMDRLPNNWTTIYELAKLDDAKFKQLVDEGALQRDVTMQRIRDLTPERERQEKPTRVVLDINKVARVQRKSFAKELKDLLEKFDVELPEGQKAGLNAFIGTAQKEQLHANAAP